MWLPQRRHGTTTVGAGSHLTPVHIQRPSSLTRPIAMSLKIDQASRRYDRRPDWLCPRLVRARAVEHLSIFGNDVHFRLSDA